MTKNLPTPARSADFHSAGTFIAAALLLVTAGCKRAERFELSADKTPLGMVCQFTNLLATGSPPNQRAAARALATFTSEAWDPASQSTAVTALLQTSGRPDTNLQFIATVALSRVNPAWLPSWSEAVLSSAASAALASTNPSAAARRPDSSSSSILATRLPSRISWRSSKMPIPRPCRLPDLYSVTPGRGYLRPPDQNPTTCRNSKHVWSRW